jgi:hypothetical protein
VRWWKGDQVKDDLQENLEALRQAMAASKVARRVYDKAQEDLRTAGNAELEAREAFSKALSASVE